MRRRSVLSSLLVLLFAAVSAAEPPDRSRPLDPRTIDPRAVPPLPRLGLPLPSIGLPLPPLGLQTPQSPKAEMHHTAPPRRSGHRGRYQGPAVVYLMPPYLMPPYLTTIPGGIDIASSGCAAPCAAATVDADGTGLLRVEVLPRDVGEVYLDGIYVGAAGRGWEDLPVDAGIHAIEIRADGYQTVQDSLVVTTGRPIIYKRTLRTETPDLGGAAAPAPSTPAPRAPVTYYMIRGCYFGNVPPAEASLPPNCDPQDATAVLR